MNSENEYQNFMRVVDLTGNLAASSKIQVDLGSIYKLFGHNLNTLSIVNTSNKPITVTLDGEEFQYVTGDNGSLNFDHEDGVFYSLVSIKNEDAANVLDLSEIKISAGRTGK